MDWKSIVVQFIDFLQSAKQNILAIIFGFLMRPPWHRFVAIDYDLSHFDLAERLAKASGAIGQLQSKGHT